MCFSAQASFTAAAVLSVIGIASVYKAKTNTLRLFACTPLFFALQQAFEGIVWIGINNNTATTLHTAATYGFVFFAGIFWPIWIPSIIYALETQASAKKLLIFPFISGVSIASISTYMIIALGPVAHITQNHLAYDKNASHVPFLFILVLYGVYALAAITPFFITNIHTMPLIGTLLLLSFISSSISAWASFGSIWCFFAALISALMYIVVMQENKKHSTI